MKPRGLGKYLRGTARILASRSARGAGGWITTGNNTPKQRSPSDRGRWAFYYITLTLPEQGDRLSIAFHSETICLEGEQPSHAVPTATLFGVNTLGV